VGFGVVVTLAVVALSLLLVSCPEPIDEELMTEVEDDIKPVIALTTPSASTVTYRSTVIFSGTFTDDAVEEGDGLGSISKIQYTVLDHSKLGQQIEEIGSKAISLEKDDFTFDPESGTFGFTLDTTNPDLLTGTQTLTLKIWDKNGNVAEYVLTMNEYPSGPHVEITAPDDLDEYVSEVTLKAQVRNANEDEGLGEIAQITSGDIQVCDVSVKVGSNDAILVGLNDTPDEDGNNFVYSFMTTGETDGIEPVEGDVIVRIIAKDKNGHTTTKSLTLVNDGVGPYIVLDTPEDSSYYDSGVTFSGTITSSRDDTGTYEIASFYYRIGGETFDLYSLEADTETVGTFDTETGEFSFDISLVDTTGTQIVKLVSTDKNENLRELSITLLDDTAGPELTITEPNDGDYYRSSVTFSGSVTTSADDTGLDEVRSLSYKYSGTNQEYIEIYPVSDSSPGTFDDATGEFSIDLSFVDTTGTQIVRFQSEDLNGNTSEVSLTLSDDEKGPEVACIEPIDGSYYRSTVAVTGSVANSSSDSALSEVRSLSWAILGKTEAAELDFTDGSFAFDFSTTAYTGPLKVIVTAEDYNGHLTEKALDLSEYTPGMDVTIATPTDGQPYGSRFTVTGTVFDTPSVATFDELDSLIIWLNSEAGDDNTYEGEDLLSTDSDGEPYFNDGSFRYNYEIPYNTVAAGMDIIIITE